MRHFLHVFWSLIITVLWMTTHRIELVAIIGLLLASALSTAIPPEAQRVGYILIAICIGVLLYNLIVSKLTRSS